MIPPGLSSPARHEGRAQVRLPIDRRAALRLVGDWRAGVAALASKHLFDQLPDGFHRARHPRRPAQTATRLGVVGQFEISAPSELRILPRSAIPDPKADDDYRCRNEVGKNVPSNFHVGMWHDFASRTIEISN